MFCIGRVFLIWAAILFFCPGIAAAWPVPDTGQAQCYNEYHEIPCPEPGEPFYGQDAQYAGPPRSYTKLGQNGVDLPDTATRGDGWIMTRDNVTGLIWEIKQPVDGVQNYSDPHDADNLYTWYDQNPEINLGEPGTPGDGTDTEDFINALNDSGFGGYSDWRLPTMRELSTLVWYLNPLEYLDEEMFVDPRWFPDLYNCGILWSSTTVVGDGCEAWMLNVQSGNLWTEYKGVGCSGLAWGALAVRAGQGGASGHLVDNGDGTVIDLHTGLMWQQKTPAERYDWEQALAYAETLTLAGYSDWRLPNRNELQTLVDYSRRTPAANSLLMMDVLDKWDFNARKYWSSTNDARIFHEEKGIVFDYDSGNIQLSEEKGSIYRVRAVRAGLTGSSDDLTISAPLQGTIWQIGKTANIRWTPGQIAGSVSISLSRKGGLPGTFETIADSTLNDGLFEWEVTGPASANCMIRIEPGNNPGAGVTAGLFSIDELAQISIDVEPIQTLKSYRLSLKKKFQHFGIRPVETSWNISDTSVATVNRGVVTALQNGCVLVSTLHEDQEYVSRPVHFKTARDQWESEPNGSINSATPLSECRSMGAELTPDDEDYFSFSLPQAALVNLGHYSFSTSADVTMEVLTPDETLLAQALSENGKNLSFSLGLDAGDYYVRLFPSGDVDQDATYNLFYSTSKPISPPDETDIRLDESVEAYLNHLDDKQVFTLNTSALIPRQSVTLRFAPSSVVADYHIAVLDAGNTVIRQADSTGGKIVTIYAIPGGGSYTVEVTPIGAIDAINPFTISAAVSDDYVEIESNDALNTATPLHVGELIKGALGTLADTDFYTLRLEAPQYLTLSFICPDSKGDFAVSVYKDSELNLINSITASAGAEAILPMGLGVGRYYLRVEGNGTVADVGLLYSLSLAISDRTDLEIESNNTTLFATPIGKEAGRTGRVFSVEDVDYFGFTLPESTYFTVDFTPSTTTGDYRISLVDNQDAEFYYKTSTNGAATTLRANCLPGQYFVRIISNGDVDQHEDYEIVMAADADINPTHEIVGLTTLVSISVSTTLNELNPDDEVQLAATAHYSDTSSSPLADALWSSLDPAIGSVDQAGLLTGIAAGEVTVVATYGGLVGQATLTVGSPPQEISQRYGNLIIVAGSGANYSDSLAKTAQYLADLVYGHFQTRLFEDEDIYYFNPVSFHDIDGDGLDNDIVDDDNPTVNEFAQVVTDWAANQSTDGPLYIYLVGHGEIGGFYFPNETMSASQMKGFIDTFQAATGRQVVVIIEACKSGSFAGELVAAGQNRVVVTSTDDQDAYMQFDGRISFTQFFLNKLLGGESFHQSWLAAKGKLAALELPFSRMLPQLLEGISTAANQTWLGGNFRAPDMPLIRC